MGTLKVFSPQPVPPLQPLFFRQTCLLALLAGMAGYHFLLPAATLALLLFWVDSRAWHPLRGLLLVLCLGCGLCLGWITEPDKPHSLPLWLEHSLQTRHPVWVEGEISDVRGLSDQRLQLQLQNVRPFQSLPTAPSSLLFGEQLPGTTIWIWEKPTRYPLPGQRIRAPLLIRPIQGFHNAGMRNMEESRSRQGLFFQATLREKANKTPLLLGVPTWSAHLRATLHARVLAALSLNATNPASSEGKGILPALLFGDRFFLSTSVLERITDAGLMHSLALSGQHLAVVGLAALALLTCIRQAKPTLFLHIPAFHLLGLLSIPLAGLYLWLGNAPPSLIRAALMLSGWCLLRWRASRTGQPTTFPDILFLALICLLLVSPGALFNLGVQLSFAAVAGIALCTPLLRRLWLQKNLIFSPVASAGETQPIRTCASRMLSFLWLTLGCSLAAQAATLPLILDAFGRTSLWFLLNLVWLPILGCIVLPAAFLGLFCLLPDLPFFSSIGMVFFRLAAWPCELLLDSLNWLHVHAALCSIWTLRPHWTGALGFWALLVSLALRSGRNSFPSAGKRCLVAALVLLAVSPLLWANDLLKRMWSPEITLRVLDVGQGQALVLEWPGEGQILPRSGRALLDGGGFFSNRLDTGRDILAPVLTDNRFPELDWIAFSHPDQDHLRGLLFIASHFSVPLVWSPRLPGVDVPYPASPHPTPLTKQFLAILSQRGIPRHPIEAGDTIPLAHGLELEVLAPPRGRATFKNNGLILRLVNRGHGLALLPGDAEAPALRALLQTGSNLQADVLVLPHHGSASSLVPLLYHRVKPQFAVASAGKNNAFSHPSPAVRAYLRQQGIPLFVTAEQGEIVFSWPLPDSKNVRLTSFRTWAQPIPLPESAIPAFTRSVPSNEHFSQSFSF